MTSGSPHSRKVVSHSRKGMTPKYGVLAEAIRQRIAHGAWPEGTFLPSLYELAREFDVARLTARQAIQLLVQEGLVESHQGRGTFVTGQRAAVKNIKVQSTLKALTQMYVQSPPEIRTLDERIVQLPAHVGQGDERPFVRMRRVHSEGGIPYCVIAVHVEAKVFERAAQEFRNNAAIPILVSMIGRSIKKAYQTLTVRAVDAEAAVLLKVPQNSPAAYVERTFEVTAGKIVYFAEVIYRGDLVKLDIDLQV